MSGKGCRKRRRGARMRDEVWSLYNKSAPKNASQELHELKGCNCACRVQMIKLADGAEVGGFYHQLLGSPVECWGIENIEDSNMQS